MSSPTPETTSSSSPSTAAATPTTTTTGSSPRSRGVILPWSCKLSLLEQYKARKGNLLIPRNYLDPDSGYQLGRLVYRLRQGKSRLTTEQVNDLNALEFVWNRSPCTTWNKWFDLLVAYQQEYGHVCPTHKQLYQDQKLGQWVMQQRVMYERKQKQQAGKISKTVTSISQERIDRLNGIGFLWRLSTSRKEVVQQQQQKDVSPTPTSIKSTSTDDSILPSMATSSSSLILPEEALSTSSMVVHDEADVDMLMECLLQEEDVPSLPVPQETPSVKTTTKKKRSRSSSTRSTPPRKKTQKAPTFVEQPIDTCLGAPSSILLMDDADLVSFLDTLPQHADDIVTSSTSSPTEEEEDEEAAMVSSDSSAASSESDSEEPAPTPTLTKSLSVTFAPEVLQVTTTTQKSWDESEKMTFIQNFFD